MSIRYQKELNANYLILDSGSSGEEYAVRMLAENQIGGLLPFHRRGSGEKWEFCYEISGRQSLARYLDKRQITKGEMAAILQQLGETAAGMERCLLEVSSLRLEPELIFVKEDPDRLCLIADPAEQQDISLKIRGLTQYFLNKIDHADRESVEAAYELFRISSQEYFRLDDLLAVMAPDGAKRQEPEVPLRPAEGQAYAAGGEEQPEAEEDFLPEPAGQSPAPYL